jgi:integrase
MRITQRADERGNIGPPKTAAGYRIIHLPPELREILRDWREHCPISPDQLMFPNGKGRPESGANLHNRVWKPLMTAAGLVDKNGKPLFDIKSLRHFYASYRIAQGADPKQIQTEMGHSNVVVTLGIYGHLFPDETGKRAARASAMGADLVRLRQKVATSPQHANNKIAEIRSL